MKDDINSMGDKGLILGEGSEITSAEMLRSLHEASYDNETSVLAVKKFFPKLNANDMCKIAVNEYVSPIIDKNGIKELLLKCGYDETDTNQAVLKNYPSPLGFVLMIDNSFSMNSGSEVIKNYVKAFLDCLRIGDMFAINCFSEDSEWFYPMGKNLAPVVVSENRQALTKAKEAVNALDFSGLSKNIGSAISLANAMYKKLKTQKKAYILIGNGEKNMGDEPKDILNEEPPIFIASIGKYVMPSCFADMVDKNPKSGCYSTYGAVNLMQSLENILADSYSSPALINSSELWQGEGSALKEFAVCGIGNFTIVNVVWSDTRCRYTPDNPRDYTVSIKLIDPSGTETDIRPLVSEKGYCVYNLRNLRAGLWRISLKYAFPEAVYTTVGVIDADSDTT